MKKIIIISLVLLISLSLGTYLMAQETADDPVGILHSWKEIKERTQYKGQCKPLPQYSTDLCYPQAKKAYHDFINCMFNEVIDEISNNVAVMSKNSDDLCLSPPQYKKLQEKLLLADLDPETKQPIGIAITATEEYGRYLQYLDYQLDHPIDNGCLLKDLSQTTFDQVQQKKEKLQKDLEEESERAKQSLIIAFSALKEMPGSFKLHKRYECIIDHLQKYRDQILRIRQLTNCVYARFKKPRTSKGM